MYYCIGKNAGVACVVGSGATVEAAVNNWAYTEGDIQRVSDEFRDYKPSIIEGELLRVEMEVITNIKFNVRN